MGFSLSEKGKFPTAFVLEGCPCREFDAPQLQLLSRTMRLGPSPHNTHTKKQPSCAQTLPEHKAGVTTSDSCARLCPHEALATTSRSIPGTAPIVDAIPHYPPLPSELFKCLTPSTCRATLVMSPVDVTSCRRTREHFGFPALLHRAKCLCMRSIPYHPLLECSEASKQP